MKRLVEFPLKDGSKVIVEVDALESESPVRAGRGVNTNLFNSKGIMRL